MTLLAAAVLYAVFLWWFTTGAIIWLDRRAERTWPRTMLAATGLGLVALAGLVATRGDTSVAGAFLAFTCAVLVWGWIEVAFLLGYVTGPRRTPHPPAAGEWARFGGAVGAILWHELFTLAMAASVILITQEAPNRAGLWTFLVLWAMRLSAKLNLFLGVANRGEELLPERMRYLGSYFGRRSFNLLFPVAVTGATALAALLWLHAASPGASPQESAALALVAAMLTLAVVEHWFMVLPLPGTALWQWAMEHGPRPAAASRGPAAASPTMPGRVLEAAD